MRAVLPSTYGDHTLRVLQSSAADLNVTVAGYSTIGTVSTGSVRVHQSSAADLNVTVAGYSTIATVSTGSVRVHQSSAADLNVTVAGYSTTVNVSSVSGPVVVRSSAADAIVTVKNSTIGELLASVQQNSTVWQTQTALRTSSGGSLEGSTLTPGAGILGLHVRQVPSSVGSTSVVLTSSNSTVLLPVLSSQAAAQRVHAYFVGVSTTAGPSTVIFMSGTTNHVWGMVMTSAVWGANLAVSPPGELFRANAGEALNVVFQAGTTAVTGRITLGWRQDV